MLSLTNEEKNYIGSKRYVLYAKKNLVLIIKNMKRLEIIAVTLENRRAVHEICNLRHKIQKEIPAIFHNSSTYDYHFITNELAEKIDGQFGCLGENAEKYLTFSAPIKKELDNGKRISSFRSISNSLSSLIDLKELIVISPQIVNLLLDICQSKMIN